MVVLRSGCAHRNLIMPPQLLSSDQINESLKQVSSWSSSGKQIERNFELKDFAAALALINAIGEQAEAMDHHPDMLFHGWNKVRVTISTHSVGGLTQSDFDLASRINALPQAAA
jgi:4a-hydroxytetrahydrobiopterin dehydratase